MEMSYDGGIIASFLSVLLWVFRLRASASDVWLDLRWILLCGLWVARGPTLGVAVTALPSPESFARLLLICIAIPSLCLFLAIVLLRSWGHFSDQDGGKAFSHDESSKTIFLRPLIFPSRTTHARFFPKKHSFSYSYLLVGVPIGWRGRAGSLLSVDEDIHRSRRSGWLNVRAADYLHRGDDARGLRGKLESFLEMQNERLSDYPHVYLITAPRFLGYAFNPVSFWYLYNEAKELKAIILEVNNTFDERRMYFLKGTSSEATDLMLEAPTPKDAAASIAIDDAETETPVTGGEKPKRFSSTWAKDFHVSPFNSRKGAYALSAQDIFRRGKIDNTITLRSSQDHPKLVARMFSSGACIDPVKTNHLDTLRFLAAWWWVGFMTFPRIVKEAAKLFFRRKLHVWYRPEVSKESIGRQATTDESVIEQCFHAFLKFTVATSSSRLPVKYTSPMTGTPRVFYPPSSTERHSQEYLEFNVTSPLFYTQIIRHAHLTEFFTASLFPAQPESQLFYISDPATFVNLFKRRGGEDRRREIHTARAEKLSSTEASRWRFLRWLRSHSRKKSSLIPSSEGSASDIRSFPYSQLDEYVMQTMDVSTGHRYRSVVTKVLASDLIAFGQPALIDALNAIVRILLCWVFVRGVGVAFIRPIPGEWVLKSNALPRDGLCNTLLSVLEFCGLHMWWFLGKSL